MGLAADESLSLPLPFLCRRFACETTAAVRLSLSLEAAIGFRSGESTTGDVLLLGADAAEAADSPPPPTIESMENPSFEAGDDLLEAATTADGDNTAEEDIMVSAARVISLADICGVAKVSRSPSTSISSSCLSLFTLDKVSCCDRALMQNVRWRIRFPASFARHTEGGRQEGGEVTKKFREQLCLSLGCL